MKTAFIETLEKINKSPLKIVQLLVALMCSVLSAKYFLSGHFIAAIFESILVFINCHACIFY